MRFKVKNPIGFNTETIAGGLALVLSLRVLYAIARWQQLNRIEKKVS